jgi:hypothetical protein
MSQKRFLNFGTTADAGKTKAIVQQLFGAQLLRGDVSFFSTVPPDQLVLQPHAVVFDSGLVLAEDEVVAVTIATSSASANYTIYYEHIDADQIGGAAATLRTVGGLQTSVSNGVVLGWVVYPGGAVPLDNTMVFSAVEAQVNAGRGFAETVKTANDGTVIARDSTITTQAGSSTIRALSQTIPAFPFQITNLDLVVSRLLPLEADQHVRVYNRDDAAAMTRVVVGPATGEYSLDEDNGTFTFAEADEGKVINIADITYGADLDLTKNSSPTATAMEEVILTFPVTDILIKSIQVEYVILHDYTIDVVEAVGVDGSPGTITSRKDEPTTPDGSISRLLIRLLEGSFVADKGGQFTLRLRKVLGTTGAGLLLSARASTSDLPF